MTESTPSEADRPFTIHELLHGLWAAGANAEDDGR